jgi:hypothetical protein
MAIFPSLADAGVFGTRPVRVQGSRGGQAVSGAGGLFAPQRHIVAVDHLGATGEAEDRLDLPAIATYDAFGIGEVVGDEAAADLFVGRASYRDRVASVEVALDATNAGRQQAFAGTQRLDRAGVDDKRASGLEPS